MQLQNDKITTLQTAIQTAYLDHTINSNLAYRPEFISNNYKLGKKVLVSIEEELQRCEEFCISVAFITKSGITPLLQTLKDLEQKNIPGKILTTNYLMFSEPEALEKLAGLKNIELKMYIASSETGGFHTKGYIFREEEIYRIIIGSSNMTLSAITKNKEWNTKIVSTEQGEFHVTMPKTEVGIREIPMSKMVAKAFETQRRLNFQMGIPRDVKIEGLSNFVFMSRSGRPMMPTTVNFILRDIVKAYNEEENEYNGLIN